MDNAGNFCILWAYVYCDVLIGQFILILVDGFDEEKESAATVSLFQHNGVYIIFRRVHVVLREKILLRCYSQIQRFLMIYIIQYYIHYNSI